MSINNSNALLHMPKVELHLHLDGAIRPETIWDISKQKGMTLGNNIGSFEELKKALVITDPIDLSHFLEPFGIYMPCFVDDFDAMERIAYELCESEAKCGVIYFEARYSPHFFLSNPKNNMSGLRRVVDAINRGFGRGEDDFKVKARSILCSLTGLGFVDDVFSLCEHYRSEGVVAIDTAACCDRADLDEVSYETAELRAYNQARQLGIHRTMHAGETGGPEMVKRAVQDFYAERIGHGYNVVQDTDVYKYCLQQNIHFETCPNSSILTGSISKDVKKHPILVFAEDNANFSINSDDPTETGAYVINDYELAKKWGLSDEFLAKTNLNAARSCFLPEDEKSALIKKLEKCFGLSDD